MLRKIEVTIIDQNGIEKHRGSRFSAIHKLNQLLMEDRKGPKSKKRKFKVVAPFTESKLLEG